MNPPTSRIIIQHQTGEVLGEFRVGPGEHGVGLEKLSAMKALFSEEDLEAFRRVRAVWDPDLRLNPGKLVPMRACMEIKTRPAVAGS